MCVNVHVHVLVCMWLSCATDDVFISNFVKFVLVVIGFDDVFLYEVLMCMFM